MRTEHLLNMKHIILILLLTGSLYASNPQQQSSDSQNMCILKHMLTAYTGNDILSFSNMANLFDAITLGYHQEANPTHMSESEVEKDESEEEGHKHKRGIHTVNLTYAANICPIDMEHALHECLPGSVLLERRGYNANDSQLIGVNDFKTLCPSFLYQLTMTPCMHHPHSFLSEQTTPLPISATNTEPYLAWVGAIASVVTISLVGLATISIIPLLSKTVYKVAIQYLVALAVGTLVGDALLHLLPHALSEHDHMDTDLRSSKHHVWRATVSLVGIYVFFNAERILGVITSVKNDKKKPQSRRQSLVKKSTSVQLVGCDSDNASCRSCDVTIVIGHSAQADCKPSNQFFHPELNEMVDEAHKEVHKKANIPLCDESNENLVTLPKGSAINENNHNNTSHLKRPSISNLRSQTSTPESKDETTPMLSRTLSDSRSGKQEKSLMDNREFDEGHGHSHEVPSSCSSVAYMVIMGDGLHNFTDGLAIGAAFSSSFTGGLSTAIAVLCHELPHELGDFAMLLKSGMSVRQAYLCNLFSASLQCIGVVIGVLIGNMAAASQWLFAFAGGIFLYVGLVDMLPEITKIDHQRKCKQLLLQNLGLLTGFGLMLVIAAFETDIENMFTTLTGNS